MRLFLLLELLSLLFCGPEDTAAQKVCDCDSSLINKTVNLPSDVAAPRPDGQPDAMRVGDLLYINDQMGEDLQTRQIKRQSLDKESRQALENVLTILHYAGCTYRNVAMFSWEMPDVAHLELIDMVQAGLKMNSGSPDTVYSAGRGYGVGFTLPRNSSFAVNYVAYACNWKQPLLPPVTDVTRTCACQQPYNHHAWNLPAEVSAPVPPNKSFKRVSRAGRNVYITGTIGQDFISGAVVDGGLEAQLNKSLDNIALQLAQAGCSFDNVIRVETLLKNLSLASTVNSLYQQYFGSTKAKDVFTGTERLISGLKYKAVIQHIVDARDCNFTKPQFSVTPPEILDLTYGQTASSANKASSRLYSSLIYLTVHYMVVFTK